MNYLEKLITELCNNGVKYQTIKELAEVGTGSSNGNEAQDDGLYPFFIRSQTVKCKNDWEYDEEAIIIPGEGGIGEIYHYINGKYAIHQRVYRIHFIDDSMNVKFAFHYFRAYFKQFIIKKAVSATVQSIRKPMIEDFSIPVPSPEIQKEIVQILDTFTEITAELTAELTTRLTARKKQYKYYRDQLLNFKEKNVDWSPLEEIFELKNGYTPSKLNQKYWKDGTIPWFRMEDIRENGRVLNKSIQYVNSCAIKGGKLFPADSIIIATSATIGEHALITVPFLCNQRFTNLSLKSQYTNKFLIKFLFYYGFVLDEWCKNNINIGNFAGVDMNGFKKFPIPIPPLEEQARIVSILDKFDTLATSISEGLPKEIELRQKQYEYYRDMLLIFPKDKVKA